MVTMHSGAFLFQPYWCSQTVGNSNNEKSYFSKGTNRGAVTSFESALQRSQASSWRCGGGGGGGKQKSYRELAVDEFLTVCRQWPYKAKRMTRTERGKRVCWRSLFALMFNLPFAFGFCCETHTLKVEPLYWALWSTH